MNNNYHPGELFQNPLNNSLPLGNVNQPNNQLYIQNFIRKNKGKTATFHLSFPDSIEWRDRVFTGVIEEVGNDFVLINEKGNHHLLWSIYIDYVEFHDKPNY